MEDVQVTAKSQIGASVLILELEGKGDILTACVEYERVPVLWNEDIVYILFVFWLSTC